MPFVKRKIEPSKLRRFKNTPDRLFDEHSDFANNAMVNCLLQLASITFHAEDIFKEIETESKSIYKRLSNLKDRLQRAEEITQKLDPKSVQIPVSDLDTEFKIPSHLQYQCPNSVEEDFFTTDSRNPCLIHLHQLARNDFSDVVRGAQAYAKPARPKSFDPNMLLDDKSSSDSMLPSKSTVNIAASRDLNELFNPKGLLPTPQKKMELDTSQHKAEMISVDTSGAQFDRRVNLRRSQRSTVSGTRKSHAKLRERHKTLTALPDYVSSELGMYGMQRQNSLHSDVNSTSSFLGDSSVISADSSLSRARTNGDAPATDRSDLSSSGRAGVENRHSVAAIKSVSSLPSRGAHVTLTHPDDDGQVFGRGASESKPDPTPTSVHLDHVMANDKQQPIMREKNGSAEDRISSGFWSGTESCRLSVTSETLTQASHVTLTPTQNFSAKQDESRANISDNDTNASSLSLNSRLSTFDRSLSSSFVSLTCTPVERSSTPDDSMCTQRLEPVTPHQMNFSTPAGAYNFLNPDYVEEPAHLPHLSSPMDLIIIGNRRGSDGLIKDTMGSFDVSGESYSAGVDVPDGAQYEMQQPLRYDHHPAFTPNTPHTATFKPLHSPSVLPPYQTRFFPSDFSTNHNQSSQRNSSIDQTPTPMDFQSELKVRLASEKQRKNSLRKPPPPRRQSSLKSRHREVKEILAYMEPLSSVAATSSHVDHMTSNSIRSSTPRSSSPSSPAVRESLPSPSSEGESPPANIASYQPSKSVASMLSKRPSTMYNFHLSPSPVERPVSVVEPIPQSFPSPPTSPVQFLTSTDAPTSPPVNNSPSAKPLDAKKAEKSPLKESGDDSVQGLVISPALLKSASQSLTRVSSEKQNDSKPSPHRTSISDESSPDTPLSSTTPCQTSSSIERSSAGRLSNSVKSPPPVSAKPQRSKSVNADSRSNGASPQKPPVATKPNLSLIKKPLIRPKPALLPRPISHPGPTSSRSVEAEQRGMKTRQVKEKTADLRADFFRNMSTDAKLSREKAGSRDYAKNDEMELKAAGMVNGAVPENHVVADIHVNHNGDVSHNEQVTIDAPLGKKFSTEKKDSEKIPSADEDSVKSNQKKVLKINSLEDETVVRDEDEIQSIDKAQESVDVSPSDPVPSNGVDSSHVDQIDGDDITADVFESPTSFSKKFDFKSSMHKLRDSYSTMPLENGFKSPISPLIVDRRSNSRYTTSSLDRRRKTNSASAKRDDFKNLLLQNLSKSGGGSQMSATEKLKMSMRTRSSATPATTEAASNDSTEASSPNMVSMGDIRAVMNTSRPGRRPNRIQEHRRSYAGSPSYSNKKHPPLSMSGRYNARSRTPTRPMLAIREDAENELSSDKPSDNLLRSKSVGDF